MPLVLDLLRRHGLRATLLRPGPGRGAPPRPRARDRRRRPRDRPPRLHAHARPTELSPRRGGGGARERAGGPAQASAPRSVGYRSPSWDFSAAHPRAARDARLRVLVEPHGRHPPLPPRRARRWSRCRSSGSSTTRRTSGSTARRGRRRSRRPSEVESIWEQEFRGHPSISAARACSRAPADHRAAGPPRAASRSSSRSWSGHDDVWVATTGEIAAGSPREVRRDGRRSRARRGHRGAARRRRWHVALIDVDQGVDATAERLRRRARDRRACRAV